MIEDQLVLAIPIELLALAVCLGGHRRAHGVPEAAMYVAVGVRVAGAHAVNPVVQVELAVVALLQGRESVAG